MPLMAAEPVPGVRREVSVIDLCAEFKCNAIKTSVRQTLEAYKRQFWASLNEDRRQDADFSRYFSPSCATASCGREEFPADGWSKR
jgi:hypothetical protein